MSSEVAFSTELDSATFWDKGTEVPSLSQDKGTMGQAKNLAKGWDGPEQPKSGMGRIRKGRSKTGKGCSKTEKDVLKQKKTY